MSVVLARIDNRLIHGQVLEAWLPHARANCIAVASDQVAAGQLQKTLMQAAVPSNIKVVIDTLEGVAKTLQNGELAEARVLLLFENSADALLAHRMGMPFAELNLGNMHAAEGRQRFTCTISLAPEDIENLRLLEEEEGVKIFSQCIPADRERSWRKLIKNAD